jgi:alkylhydroperoxidase family enzyme
MPSRPVSRWSTARSPANAKLPTPIAVWLRWTTNGRAYRAAVRAGCAWCAKHDLPPLPASGQDVAAFLEGERGRKLSPETLKLRRAAIHYLHRAAG